MPPVKDHHGKFPPPNSEIDWEQLVPLIGPATMALGEFKGLLDAIPNPMVLRRERNYLVDHEIATNSLVDHILHFMIHNPLRRSRMIHKFQAFSDF